MRAGTILAALPALGLLVLLSEAQAKVPLADSRFVIDAVADGMAEIELAELAQSRAARDEVKALARAVAHDHSKANAELTSLASRKRVALPTTTRPAHKLTRERLAKLSGAAFDAAFLDTIVRDHRKAVASFEREAAAGGDPDFKAWAAKTLPLLKQHLTEAEALGGRGTSAPRPRPRPE